MQLASRHLPLAELASVRRAVERVSLVACNRTERCGRHAPVLVTRAASNVAHDGEDAADAPPARRPTASSSKGGGKGFGSPSKPPSQKQQQPSRRDKVFEEEMEAEEQATGPATARPEYQLYSDDQFKPKRYIGNVQATTVEGKRPQTPETPSFGQWPSGFISSTSSGSKLAEAGSASHRVWCPGHKASVWCRNGVINHLLHPDTSLIQPCAFLFRQGPCSGGQCEDRARGATDAAACPGLFGGRAVHCSRA